MTKSDIDSLIELQIVDLGVEGKAIGKIDEDFVVFVDNCIPGDFVKARIKKVKKNYAEAKCEEIIIKSVHRIEPKCEYFRVCNGCKTQNIEYSNQLEIKRNAVKNAFERIGGFKEIEIPTVLGSENIFYYRNKLEFSFTSNRWLTADDMNKEIEDKKFALGYHIPNFIDKVLDIHACYLQSEISVKIVNHTRDFFKSRNESIYSTKTHSGYLRFLVIRQSPITNEILVNLITSEDKPDLINEFGNHLKENAPEISTFINSISTKKSQVAVGDYSNTIFGKGFINDYIDKYQFKITPQTFFQTNTLQAKKLFEKMVELSNFSKNDSVLDLYCGCGAISLYISEYVNKVTGVELYEESINSAIENAENNNVKNCEFIVYDVKDYLKNLGLNNNKQFDTIILDPPRSGIHPKAAGYLLQLESPKIIYVSCNPSTQARDIKLLCEKYNIQSIQPVDMFPQTLHIENIVKLDLK